MQRHLIKRCIIRSDTFHGATTNASGAANENHFRRHGRDCGNRGLNLK